MVRTSVVRTKFMAFVAAIFGLAIVVALGYVFLGHPGDTKNDVKPLNTSMISMENGHLA